MQFFRRLATGPTSRREGVRQDDLTSVAPREAWSSPSPQQGGHRQSEQSNRQVHPVSVPVRAQPGMQHVGSAGRRNQIDHGRQRHVAALQGLWELDDRHMDQRRVCDLDRRLLVLGNCVQNCEGEYHPIVVNDAGTQFVLGECFFSLDVQHNSLQCTLPSGHIRIYQRLLLPGTQTMRSLQGTWRAMGRRSRKKDPPWRHLTISGYWFEGMGPGECRGFLQENGQSLRASTSIISCNKEEMVVTSNSGQSVRYFRMRGLVYLDPIEE